MTEITQPGDNFHNELLTVVRDNYPIHALNVLSAFEKYRHAHPGSEKYHLGHFSIDRTPIYELTNSEVNLWDGLFSINAKLVEGITIQKKAWLPVTDIMSEFASETGASNTRSFHPSDQNVSSSLVVQKQTIRALDQFQATQLPLINLVNGVQIRAPIVKAIEPDAKDVCWYAKPSVFIDRSYGAAMYLQVFPLHKDGRPFLWSFHVPSVEPTNLGVIHPVYVEFGFNTRQNLISPTVLRFLTRNLSVTERE